MKKILMLWVLLLLVITNKAEANVTQEKKKVTFYLLRGIGRESAHWGNTFTDHVRSNLPEAKFILMDLPGAGKYHQQSALPTVEKMADFLREQHLDQVRQGDTYNILVATSLAGNVAFEWITQYPGDFDGAVLLSTSLKGVCKGKQRVQADAKKQFVDIFLTNDLREREAAFLSINSNANIGNDSLLTAWVNIQRQRPVTKNALMKQTVAGMLYKPSSSPEIPVLLVGSKGDKIVADECFRQIANAYHFDLILHETAGHGIPIDAPMWLADTTSVWASEVIDNSPVKHVDTIPTRTKDNGLLPVVWLDNSNSRMLEGTKSILNSSGKALNESWQWADHSVDRAGQFLKTVQVKEPRSRR